MSAYLHCATARGVEEHLRDGESCPVCKDWIKKHGLKIRNGKIVNPPKQASPTKPAPKRPARPARPKTVRAPQPEHEIVCGTVAGYRLHRREKETACDPCKKALADNQRQYNRIRRERQISAGEARRSSKYGGTPPPPPLIPEELHGTIRGYRRHLAHGEKPCERCAETSRENERRRYRERKAKK